MRGENWDEEGYIPLSLIEPTRRHPFDPLQLYPSWAVAIPALAGAQLPVDSIPKRKALASALS